MQRIVLGFTLIGLVSTATPGTLPAQATVASPGGVAVMTYRDMQRVEFKWDAPAGTSNLKLLRSDVAVSPAFVEVPGAKYGPDWAIDESFAFGRLYLYKLIGFLPSGVPVGTSPISVHVPLKISGVWDLKGWAKGIWYAGVPGLPKPPAPGRLGALGSIADAVMGETVSSGVQSAPPPAPEGSSAPVTLTWRAAPEAIGYAVGRSKYGQEEITWLVQSPPIKALRYDDFGVSAGRYSYVVRAVYAIPTMTSRSQFVYVQVP